MDEYKTFDADLAACRKCADILAEWHVDPCADFDERVQPRPIVSGIRPKPVLLVGQAPSLTEYRSGKPFQGQAGQSIRDIFREAGINHFDASVYSSAVVKCYPGRKHRKKGDSTSRCEDRVPNTAMIRNCRPLLERQVALVNPSVIVTLGGLALKAYLEMARRPRMDTALENFVGTSEQWGERTVVFFPHTSGGARWLNDYAHKELLRKAKVVLRKTFARYGIN